VAGIHDDTKKPYVCSPFGTRQSARVPPAESPATARQVGSIASSAA
jgi:hypothetical protein